jgi:hypothetical protein
MLSALAKLQGFLIGENPIFKKKKCRLSAVCRDFMAVQMKNFGCPLFEISFQVRNFFFSNHKELV